MINLRIAAYTFALLWALALPAMAQPSPEELAKDPALFLESARKELKWDEPAEPARIIGPIHFVGTKGLSVFLIKTSDGHILLNTGMPGSGPMIEASIRKLGFKPEEIKLILTGHAHVDHAGGHAYLQKLSGATVVTLRQEKELLESGGKTDFHYGKIKEFGFDPVKVDQILLDEETIQLGGVTIKALLTAGHTKGSTTFVMNVVDGSSTYAVVFPNGTSVNPGYRVAKDPSYPGIGDDYRRTFRILESLQPDVWLMPHNEAYDYEAKLARAKTEGAGAWVDPEGYRKWMKTARERFEAAVAKETGK